MKMIPFVCPNCGGQLNVADGKTHMKCGWCGSDLLISSYGPSAVKARLDVNVAVKRDEARIKEAEVRDDRNKMQYDMRMLQMKMNIVVGMLYALATVVLLIIGNTISSDFGHMCSLFGMMMGYIGIMLLFGYFMSSIFEKEK